MQEEIKEILNDMKIIVEDNDDLFKIDLTLNKEDVKILLNYITNLQEELEELREDNYAYHQLMKMQNEREYRSKFLKEFQEEFGKNVLPDYDEIYKRYDKLKKENKKLKELCDKYEEEHNNAFKLWTMKIEEMPDYEERMNYKSRNEKIINKISLYRMDDITMETNRILDDLLNTARGVDKSE